MDDGEKPSSMVVHPSIHLFFKKEEEENCPVSNLHKRQAEKIIQKKNIFFEYKKKGFYSCFNFFLCKRS